MHDDAKASVKELVRELGGTYTSSMSKSNTHLVVPDARGEKFLNCPRLAVKPVTADWLIDCATQGTLCANLLLSWGKVVELSYTGDFMDKTVTTNDRYYNCYMISHPCYSCHINLVMFWVMFLFSRVHVSYCYQGY
jgi:hypothetical protein